MNRLRLQLMFLFSCLFAILFLREAPLEELFKGWYDTEGPLEVKFGEHKQSNQLMDSIRVYYPVKVDK